MSIEITDRHPIDRAEEILTDEALAFLEKLHQNFSGRRDELLAARKGKRQAAAAAKSLDFLPETAEVRTGDWQVAPAPPALQDRRVEMTGPASPAKMAINALNSGAKVWLADLEDASSPTWGKTRIRSLRSSVIAIRRDTTTASGSSSAGMGNHWPPPPRCRGTPRRSWSAAPPASTAILRRCLGR